MVNRVNAVQGPSKIIEVTIRFDKDRDSWYYSQVVYLVFGHETMVQVKERTPCEEV